MKWISVKDKLPKDYTHVLVIGEVTHSISLYTKSDGFQEHREFIYLDDVTHWMPLPKPPKR